MIVESIKITEVLQITHGELQVFYTEYSQVPMFCYKVDTNTWLCAPCSKAKLKLIKNKTLSIEDAFTYYSPDVYLVRVNSKFDFAVENIKQVYYSQLPKEYKPMPGVFLKNVI